MTTSRSARYSQSRTGAAAIDAEIANALAVVEAARFARAVEVKAARQAEKDRHRFTREEIAAAVYVLTPWNVWKRIISVNKVTVSVSDGDRRATVKFDQIRGVKA